MKRVFDFNVVCMLFEEIDSMKLRAFSNNHRIKKLTQFVFKDTYRIGQTSAFSQSPLPRLNWSFLHTLFPFSASLRALDPSFNADAVMVLEPPELPKRKLLVLLRITLAFSALGVAPGYQMA